jgi:hypothetical protein
MAGAGLSLSTMIVALPVAATKGFTKASFWASP